MEEYIELFMNHMASVNRSDTTMTQYEKELTVFAAYMTSKGVHRLEDVKTIHIDLYQSHLMKVNKSASVAKKMSVLRSFFRFLATRTYIDTNPTDALNPVKIKDADQKERETLTEKEALKLLETVKKRSVPSQKDRNQLIIMFFLFLGLRVSELCALQIRSIDIQRKTVHVLGKGGVRREVPLFDEMIPLLRTYLKERTVQSDYLFTKKKTDEPLSRRSVHDLVKSNVAAARIDKNIGCHSLRRTSATINLRSGINMRSIQRFLGHKNIGTTMLYLQEDIEDIKNEIRSQNILAKKLKQKSKKEKNKNS